MRTSIRLLYLTALYIMPVGGYSSLTSSINGCVIYITNDSGSGRLSDWLGWFKIFWEQKCIRGSKLPWNHVSHWSVTFFWQLSVWQLSLWQFSIWQLSLLTTFHLTTFPWTTFILTTFPWTTFILTTFILTTFPLTTFILTTFLWTTFPWTTFLWTTFPMDNFSLG